MTSPSVAGLPSLPALDKSMADNVNESVNTGCLLTLGLMRGPDAVPHADFAGAVIKGEAEAREGKAD